MNGPLIGILTSKSKFTRAYTGNIALFKKIQHDLQRNGFGTSIVFTPEDVKRHKVRGIMFKNNKWYSVFTPLPNIVYNRIPFREHEDKESFLQLKSFFQENKIPFFNACFFSKWEVYNILKKHANLKQLLPETILLQKQADLEMMLAKYRKVYVKHVNGHQGNGISFIKFNHKREISYSTLHSTQKYASIQKFWESVNLDFSRAPSILQEAITPDTLDGKRYDLRILVHLQHGRFVISGIGVRKSTKQQITTHVPNGGKIIPFRTIQHKFNLSHIEQIIDQCGQELTKEYGLIGEFSVDMGLSKSERLYLFEINSKPMVFDEPEIKETGLNNLISLFYELTEFC